MRSTESPFQKDPETLCFLQPCNHSLLQRILKRHSLCKPLFPGPASSPPCPHNSNQCPKPSASPRSLSLRRGLKGEATSFKVPLSWTPQYLGSRYHQFTWVMHPLPSLPLQT